MNKGITIIITYAQKNKVYNIEIDPSAKVKDLIQEFQDVVQPNAREIISLKYNGKILEPESTFREQMIMKGSNIDLVVTTQGG